MKKLSRLVMLLPPWLTNIIYKKMILLIIILRVAYASALTLKFVHVVHRHGDRTPVATYPTDPYPPSMWKEGLGQLTDLGKHQLLSLGRYIRLRYQEFLPMEYSRQDIYVEASEVPRAIVSAKCLLAGLYQYGSHAEIIDIPIHVIPFTKDDKIVNTASCPKLDSLQDDILQNEVTEDKQQEYDEVLRRLSEFTGLDLSYSYSGLTLATALYDTFNNEESKGLPLPDWTVDFYPEPLREMSGFMYYELPFYTSELKRLRCGRLIKDIFQHFDDCIKGNTKLRMWEYSGHDSTIGDVLVCLDVFDNTAPPVASAVFLELYQDEHGEFRVLITYKKEDTEEILIVPGCSEYCPLDELKELVSDIIPDDRKAECYS